MFVSIIVFMTFIPLVARIVPALAAPQPASVTVPFDLAANLSVLDVRINGEAKRFVLDTGASQTLIADAAARTLRLESVEQRSARGAGGDIEVSLAAVKSVDVGGAAVRNLTCVISDISGIGERLGGRLDGVLGFDFLSRFRLTIDYAARRLTLDRYAETASAAGRVEGDRFTHPASGLSVTRPDAEWE